MTRRNGLKLLPFARKIGGERVVQNPATALGRQNNSKLGRDEPRRLRLRDDLRDDIVAVEIARCGPRNVLSPLSWKSGR